MSETLEFLTQLIACPSITPLDANCQDLISHRLKRLNFTIEFMHFGEVTNLWARRNDKTPLLVFAGHTDVVPPGPYDAWVNNPFAAVIKEGYLYGRGACDMKGGLAAMVVAVENFISAFPNHQGSIAFLLTSDEEGNAKDGTKRVMNELINRNEIMDYCIVGEPSSENVLGDQIRVGRRGSLNGTLTIFGKQGHIAFPNRAKNPIHLVMPFLQELITYSFDKGYESFPPTSLQISNIHAGENITNIIPETITILFNIRFSPAQTIVKLQETIMKMLEKFNLAFDLQWQVAGEPFLTQQGKLISVVTEAIYEVTAMQTALTTGGGTSDARFIAPIGAEVIELGVCNTTAHQINERVKIAELDQLTIIYQKILEKILL